MVSAKISGSANVVVIAIHAGDDGMLQSKRGDGFGDATRLIPIDRLGTAFGHGAESAAASADIAQQHEGRGLVIPALADVRALRRFADGVQPKPARQLFQVMEVFANRSFRPQPLRLGLPQRRTKLDLDELEVAAIV